MTFATPAVASTELLRTDAGSAVGGGGRRGIIQEASTGKLNREDSGGSVKQSGTKKSKEDLLSVTRDSTLLDRPPPHSDQEHGSPDSSDLDRFFEDSSKPHTKGPK